VSGFLFAPVFLPYQQPLENGAEGDVLSIVGGQRAWAPGGGGGGGVGTYATSEPAAGIHNNFAIGAGVGRYDIDTTLGNVELTGIVAGTDGQLLIVTNIGANILQLDSLNAGSLSANRMRLPGNMVLVQNNAQLLCYYGDSVNKWCQA
jgi:hypothetical protein